MYLKVFKAFLLCLCIAAVAAISFSPNSLAADGDLNQQVQELIQQNKALTDRINPDYAAQGPQVLLWHNFQHL
jgi:hypothetical protein